MSSSSRAVKTPDSIVKNEPNALCIASILGHDMNRGMILFLQALGYPASVEFMGTCFAMTEMAQHAIYANDITNFNFRLYMIREIIQSAIQETYDLIDYPRTINNSLLKQKTEGAETIPLTKLHENIRKKLEALKEEKPAEYWDCLAMCDAVVLYQEPAAKDSQGTPYYRDVLPFIPPGQIEGGLQVVSRIVMPAKIETERRNVGLFVIEKLHQQQLSQYLLDFKEKMLETILTHPISFSFGVEHHAIKITLNPGGTWSFFNINDHPPGIKNNLDTKTLINKVWEAYPEIKRDQELKGISFNVVAHKDEAAHVYNQLITLHEKPIWKKIVKMDPLENAARFGNQELVKEILRDKQKIKKMKSQIFFDVLISACNNGHMDIAKMLIQTGKLGSADLGGVLQIACRRGNTEAVNMLIKTCQCSKYTIYNPFSKKLLRYDVETGFTIACEGGHKNTAIALIENSGVISSSFLVSEFHKACKNKKLAAIAILIKANAISEKLIISEFKNALAALHKKAHQKNNDEISRLPEYHLVHMLLNSGRLNKKVCIDEFLRDCRDGNEKKIQHWKDFHFKIDDPSGMYIPSLEHFWQGLGLAKDKHPKVTKVLLPIIDELSKKPAQRNCTTSSLLTQGIASPSKQAHYDHDTENLQKWIDKITTGQYSTLSADLNINSAERKEFRENLKKIIETKDSELISSAFRKFTDEDFTRLANAYVQKGQFSLVKVLTDARPDLFESDQKQEQQYRATY